MHFKRSLKKLNLFKKEMRKYEHLEDTEISSILKWVKERQKKVKTISKLINLNQCSDWYLDKNNNLSQSHNFKVKGVVTKRCGRSRSKILDTAYINSKTRWCISIYL